MGNNTGKILGTVAGAGLQLVPGVGTVAGIAILAATTTTGSVVDAVVDNNRQNSEADRAAEEARRRNAEAIEAQRQRERQAQEAQEAIIRRQQEQNNLVNDLYTACRNGNVAGIPGLLQRMDNDHFEGLGTQPLAVCNSANTRAQVQRMMDDEEHRRDDLLRQHTAPSSR